MVWEREYVVNIMTNLASLKKKRIIERLRHHRAYVNKNMSAIGDFLKQKTEVEMDFHKRQASGESIDSLYEVSTATGLQIKGSESWKYINEGRTAGKRPPMGVIEQWIKDKGIVPEDISIKSLAFLIGRKIGNEGIPNSGGGIKEPQLKITTQVLNKNKTELDKLVRSQILDNFKIQLSNGL